MNWSISLRQRAAELFEKGMGYKAVSSELGINRETVRDWSYTWRVVEVMAKYHILNRYRVKEWVRMYLKEGEEAFF